MARRTWKANEIQMLSMLERTLKELMLKNDGISKEATLLKSDTALSDTTMMMQSEDGACQHWMKKEEKKHKNLCAPAMGVGDVCRSLCLSCFLLRESFYELLEFRICFGFYLPPPLPSQRSHARARNLLFL